MKHFALLTAILIALAASAIAQDKATSHASREAVVQFLRNEGIISGKTQVVSVEWNEEARWWFVALRHPSGMLSNWTVDAAAKDYHYVCKN
jgi:hypothetical protein